MASTPSLPSEVKITGNIFPQASTEVYEKCESSLEEVL